MSSVSKKMMQAAAGGGGAYWINLLGGSGRDYGQAVAIDSSDNIIICGRTNSDGTGNYDLLVAKYDSLGTLQWNKTLGSSSTDYGYAVAIDSSDNIIVCGRAYTAAEASFCLLVAKYNSSGVLQWVKTLGAFGTEYGYAVAIDSNDNIVVCGITESYQRSINYLLVAKYNSSGALQWDKALGGYSDDEGFGVAIDSSDNIIVCGNAESDGAGGEDLLVAKYDSSGTLQWDKTLGGSGGERGYAVAIDSSDNIIVCGYESSDGTGGYDLLVAKYNSSGTLQWNKTLGGSGSDQGYGVAIDSSDNIVVCGYTNSDGAGDYDLLVAKYNSSGGLQWDKTLGGSGRDYGQAVAIDSSDNIIICGRTNSDGAGGYDLLVAKLSPDGTGDGTYGSLVYQDAVLTDAAAVLTDAAAVLTADAAGLRERDAASVLTDAPAVLTEEFFKITP